MNCFITIVTHDVVRLWLSLGKNQESAFNLKKSIINVPNKNCWVRMKGQPRFTPRVVYLTESSYVVTSKSISGTKIDIFRPSKVII